MPRVPDVLVNLPESPYTVHVSPGLLSRAGEHLAKLSKSRKAAVLTDTTVGPLHLPALEASLRSSGIEPIVATIPAGEDH
jgi:3-dehydroquinate synthase